MTTALSILIPAFLSGFFLGGGLYRRILGYRVKLDIAIIIWLMALALFASWMAVHGGAQ